MHVTNMRVAHRWCNSKRQSLDAIKIDDVFRVQMRIWFYKQGWTERIAQAELFWFSKMATLVRMPDAIKLRLAVKSAGEPAPKVILIRRAG